MNTFINKIPWSFVILACILLGLAPFFPQPHLIEKVVMLSRGELKKSIDIFDLCWHIFPFFLLLLKTYSSFKKG